MKTNHTTEQHIEATRKVGEFAMSLGDHDLALTALLSAYATIAAAHPCCTALCAGMTKNLSTLLTDVADSKKTTNH